MKKQEALIYGLRPAVFHGLMLLLELCPSYLCANTRKGKKDNRKRKKQALLNHELIQRILAAADRFEEDHMLVALAVKRVLKSGWTGFSPRKTVEYYRKDSPIQKMARRHYSGMEDSISKKAWPRLWMHDYAMRAGPPQGPKYCQSREEIIQVLSSVYAEIGLLLGDKMDDPRAFSFSDPDSRDKANIDPEELGKELHDRIGLPWHMTTESLYYLLGVARSRVVTEDDLDHLRNIEVCIPLHHQDDVRNSQIDKMVLEWISRSKSSITLDKRNRSVGLRESLLNLPARIKELRGMLSRERRDSVKGTQKPHTTPGAETTTGVGAFVEALFGVLKDEGFINEKVTAKDFEDCIHRVMEGRLLESRDKELSASQLRADYYKGFDSEE